MQTITFEGRPVTTASLEGFTNTELRDLYNKVRSATIPGSNAINKFSSKQDGVRRTWQILGEYQAKADAGELETPKVEKPKSDKPRGKRRMHFVYPYHGDEKLKAIKDPENSLRGRAAAKLKDGAHFAEIVQVVKDFDRDRGHGPGHEERRAYEVIRLLHYYVGYGLKQDDDGKIYIHTVPPGRK